MPKNYDLPPVTALFMDSSRANRLALQNYAEDQQLLKVCGVLGDVKSLWEALRGGLRPQVLVLDLQLLSAGCPAVIRELRRLESGYHPRVLLTSAGPVGPTANRILLTSGVESIILKPYKLSALFEMTYRIGAGEEQQKTYNIRAAYTECVSALGGNRRLQGWRYLERMVCEYIVTGTCKNMKELYYTVADAENIEASAVYSAVNRFSKCLYREKTPLYRRMCSENNLSPDRSLSNQMLLCSIVDEIRRVL